MKSSTLRRSNLSKEKMAVLEALSNYKQEESSYDNSPNVYVRPGKEKELDLLWQNFKVSQKSEKSPGVYLATGFVAGAIAMLLLTGIVNLYLKNDIASQQQAQPNVKNEKVNIKPSGVVSGSSQTYTVQSGDTIESIMIKMYGSYSPERALSIQQANNLSNINKLQIGQKLIIPME